MYLLYADDSGQYKGRGFAHFVMAGVAIRDEDCYLFSQSIEQLQRAIVAAYADREIHATDIFPGRDEWARVPEEERFLTYWTPSSIPSDLGIAQRVSPDLLRCRRASGSFPGKDILEMAHLQLFHGSTRC